MLPTLLENQAHIYIIKCNTSSDKPENYISLFDKQEILRTQKYISLVNKLHFIKGRYYTKLIIGRYMNIMPKEVKIVYSPFGKPRLLKKYNGVSLQFSISHSHKLIILAFTLDNVIGVDIEYINTKLYKSLINQKILSRYEIENLLLLKNNEQARYFYHIWTGKEAFAKALGYGLSVPFNKIKIKDNKVVLSESQHNNLIIYYIQSLILPIKYTGTIVTSVELDKILYFYL